MYVLPTVQPGAGVSAAGAEAVPAENKGSEYLRSPY